MSFAEDRTEAYLENPKYSLIYTIFFQKVDIFYFERRSDSCKAVIRSEEELTEG